MYFSVWLNKLYGSPSSVSITLPVQSVVYSQICCADRITIHAEMYTQKIINVILRMISCHPSYSTACLTLHATWQSLMTDTQKALKYIFFSTLTWFVNHENIRFYKAQKICHSPVKKQGQDLLRSCESAIRSEEHIDIGRLQFPIICCEALHQFLQSACFHKSHTNSFPLQMWDLVIRVLQQHQLLITHTH